MRRCTTTTSGSPGAFLRKSLTTLSHARRRGLVTVVTTVLTRSNHRVLTDLPRLLKSAGVSGWLVAVPRVAGTIHPTTDILSPRLGLALPSALHALDASRKLGLLAWIQGAPLCLLGPYAAWSLPDEPRAYAPVCERCPAHARCPGVDPTYLARFHGDELSAREATPAEPLSSIARLFVGVGELAPSIAPPPKPIEAPPVTLTQLGARDDLVSS